MDNRKSFVAPKTFEIERGRLLGEASQGLDQLAVNLGNLTRNLETLNTIAAGFKEPSNLWHDFHAAIKPETEKEGRMDTRK